MANRTTIITMHGRKIRWGVAASVAAIALALTGCGTEDAKTGTSAPKAGSQKQESPLELVVAAVDKSTEKNTANFVMEAKISVGGQESPMSAKGSMDSKRNAMIMDMTMSEAGEDTIKAKQILIGDDMYIYGIPGMAEGKWIKMSMKDLGAAGQSVGSDATTDMSQQLQMLKSISNDDVKEAGKETVNGVETTKYTGSIDVKKAAANASKGQSADTTAKLQKQYEAMGLTSIPFELYIDDDSLPARMVIDMKSDGTQATQGKKLSMKMTMDFTDWGTDVNIKAPKKAVTLQEAIEGSLG